MGKTLILFPDKSAYYFDHVKNPNIVIEQIFNHYGNFKGLLLKLFRRLNLPFTRIFYREWYRNLKDFDKIIIFDMSFQSDSSLLYNIRRKNPSIKGYIYYWNIVKNENLFKKQKKSADNKHFELFCYDHGNCKKYDMKFNTIMYDINLRLPQVKLTTDALFLGYPKKREKTMLKLYNLMHESGFSPKFVIITNEDSYLDLPFEFKKENVNYYDYLSMINESRAIIDIAQKEQDGFSLRVMEAIFFNKKLITTNKAVKNASFYSEENILVFEPEETTADQIKEFFNKDTVEYSKEIKEYYSFENWIDRFV